MTRSPAARQLLSTALEDDTVIHLSPFDLSAEEVFQILEGAAKCRRLATLNPSRNQVIQEDFVRIFPDCVPEDQDSISSQHPSDTT